MQKYILCVNIGTCNKYFKYCKKKEIYKDEYLEKYKDIVDAIKGTKDPNTKEMERWLRKKLGLYGETFGEVDIGYMKMKF